MIENIKEQMLEDLEKLVAIPSLPDTSSQKKNAPFGLMIRQAFDVFAKIAKDKGFCVEDDDGYAISATIGEGEDYIGVLGHLDVVSAGDDSLWESHPFQMACRDGKLYGRGVNDDKGPLLAALYAAWLIQQQHLPLRYPIRIIAGGAEETTWECMEHYFAHHKQPICGFSPDGNFPIVNGEKGILQVRFLFPPVDDIQIQSSQRINFVCDQIDITRPMDADFTIGKHISSYTQENGQLHLTYRGKTALSRNPQRGENALFAFVKDFKDMKLPTSLQDCVQLLHDHFLDDFYGKKSGLYAEDVDMGTTSVCPMSLTCNKTICELCIDIRYVKTTNIERLMITLNKMADTYHATLDMIRHKRLLFVAEGSDLIQGLKKAYRKVMHEEADVLTKGGASYARVLDCGVAFGATFSNEDPKPHMPNECMPVESLLKACEIYYEALYELAVEKNGD